MPDGPIKMESLEKDITIYGVKSNWVNCSKNKLWIAWQTLWSEQANYKDKENLSWYYARFNTLQWHYEHDADENKIVLNDPI